MIYYEVEVSEDNEYKLELKRVSKLALIRLIFLEIGIALLLWRLAPRGFIVKEFIEMTTLWIFKLIVIAVVILILFYVFKFIAFICTKIIKFMNLWIGSPNIIFSKETIQKIRVKFRRKKNNKLSIEDTIQELWKK